MTLRIHGERILLRDWCDSDLAAYAQLNADPEVRRYFPSTLSREESDGEASRLRAHAEREGFTFWVLEIPGVTTFAGMVGLILTGFEAHFTPCIEVGWRLARAHWGQGYASEAAKLALKFGFETLQADEIIALTVPANTASRAVMQRIGMQHNPADDFDHPRLAADHPFRRHVLYRIDKARWQQSHSA